MQGFVLPEAALGDSFYGLGAEQELWLETLPSPRELNPHCWRLPQAQGRKQALLGCPRGDTGISSALSPQTGHLSLGLSGDIAAAEGDSALLSMQGGWDGVSPHLYGAHKGEGDYKPF